MFDDSFSGNGRQFWKYIKAKCRDSTGISPLLVNDSIVSDPQGKVAALSDQFQSVFTLEDTSNIYLNWMTTVLLLLYASNFFFNQWYTNFAT